MDNLGQVIEALVFAAGRIVSAEEIRESVNQVTGYSPSDSEIAAEVASLNERYEVGGRSFRINEWGGGFRMATLASFAPYVQTLFAESPRRLTRSLMETLSIIAYRQPATKPEIDDVRGVDSSYTLRKLMELGFVAMTGRSDTVGRPLLFGTTNKFLEEFGLLSLDDLPKLREAEELFQDERLMALRREAEFEEEAETEDSGADTESESPEPQVDEHTS